MIRIFTYFCLFCLASVQALAQMNIRLDYPVNPIEVGETIQLEVTATALPEQTRFLNADHQLPEGLAILSVKDTFLGSTLFKRRMELIPVSEDTFEFQLNLKFRVQDQMDSLLTETILIESTLIPIDQQAQLTDLKPFIEPELTFYERIIADYPFLPVIIIGILAIGVAILAIWFFKRFRTRQEDVQFIDESIQSEDVLERIHAQVKKLAEYAQSQDEWYTIWSEQLRWYLGNTYGFSGMEMTSKELMTEIKSQLEIEPIQDSLRNSLRGADMVKFAGSSLSKQQQEQDLNILTHIVEATRYKFEQSEEEEAES